MPSHGGSPWLAWSHWRALGHPPPEARADAHGDLDIRPYAGVGVEFLFLDLDYTLPANFSDDPIADSYTGVNLHFGARMGDWVGAELGFFQSGEEDQNLTVGGTPVSTESDIRGLYLDLLGYFPIGSDGPELVGSIGLSRVTFDGKVTGPATIPVDKQTESVLRFGLGIQAPLQREPVGEGSLQAAQRR